MPVTLLDPLPPDEGECHSATVPGEPFVGWRQIRLVLGDGATGLRVIVGMNPMEACRHVLAQRGRPPHTPVLDRG
jgi:hypothetical protein